MAVEAGLPPPRGAFPVWGSILQEARVRSARVSISLPQPLPGSPGSRSLGTISARHPQPSPRLLINEGSGVQGCVSVCVITSLCARLYVCTPKSIFVCV